MEDLSQLLGIKYTPEQMATLNELARRANDRLRVANPLDIDYRVAWDLAGAGGYFLVPGRTKDIGYGPGQAVHPRYIAFKFFKEISNMILSADMQKAIDAENIRRETNGMKRLDKTLESSEELGFVYEKGLKPSDPEKLMELLPKIILGVEEEWGMNPIQYTETQQTIDWKKVDAIINRPVGKPAPVATAVHDPAPGNADARVDTPIASDPVAEVAA